MDTMMQESADEDPIRRKYLNHWDETWNGFKRALVSTENFNAFGWTAKLLKAGIGFVYFKSGLDKSKIHIYWRSWVPALAIALIVLIVASYFGSLREVVRERWCYSHCLEGCRWLFFHDAVVVYLGAMILFHYVSACFRSPGVVLANQKQTAGGNYSSCTDASEPNIQNQSMQRWSSKDSRGGFCGIDPVLSITKEQYLVQNYYNLAGKSKGFSRQSKNETKKLEAFPSNRETFCNKCKIKRPPRCHHCSVCNRCILQFDHHCVWLNNCVGYNNYRAFLLTLFYLNFGCWYGIAMLYRPFLEELNANGNGWNFLRDNDSSFLELPSISTIFSYALHGTLEKEIIVKLVFPFLFAIGILQAVFFGYHLLYVVHSLTTLEYKILLDEQFDQLVKNPSSRSVTPPNPFNKGWSQNLKNAFGPLILVFLPIQVEPEQIYPASRAGVAKDE